MKAVCVVASENCFERRFAGDSDLRPEGVVDGPHSNVKWNWSASERSDKLK